MPELNGAVDGEVFLLKANEVAVLLRVPKTWVYAHQKELPGLVRLGRYVRFQRREIDRFLGEQRACE